MESLSLEEVKDDTINFPFGEFKKQAVSQKKKFDEKDFPALGEESKKKRDVKADKKADDRPVIQKVVSQEANQNEEKIKEIVQSQVQNLKACESLKSFAKERIVKILKYSFYLKFYAKVLLGDEHQITQDLNKGWIPITQEQLYAMFLQNMEAPRTSHRTQQITDGKYTYFNSNEDAVRWFTVRGEEEAKRVYQDLVKDEEKVKRDNLM